MQSHLFSSHSLRLEVPLVEVATEQPSRAVHIEPLPPVSALAGLERTPKAVEEAVSDYDAGVLSLPFASTGAVVS